MTRDSTMPVLKELLAHKDFVRRLASHLVCDEHRAEDVTQDVWIRALEHPPKGRATLRGWLARVTRSVASNTSRGERSRRHHETRAARPEGLGSVESAEHELTLQQRVVEAVQALDESHRAAILLRYFKELSHAEIASELEVPIATVRTRLHRGLAKLRALLDRAHAEDRERWSKGLLLLLGEDMLPLAPGGGGLLTGGIVMGTVAKVGVSIAILATAAWWMWDPAEEQIDPTETRTVAAISPTTGRALDRPVGLEGDAIEEERVVVESLVETEPSQDPFVPPQPSVERGWVVLGRLHGLEPEGLTKARISITGLCDYSWPLEAVVEGEVSSDGLFEVDVTNLVVQQRRLNIHAFVVAVEHPQCPRQSARLEVEEKHRAKVDLEELEGTITWWVDVHLRMGAALLGRVIRADGEPAAGATVGAWHMQGDAPESILGDSALCDESGAFVLRVATPGEHAVCAVERGMRPVTQRVIAELGSRVEAPSLFVLEEGAAISGRFLRLGEPVAEGSVSVEPTSGRGSYGLPAHRGPSHGLCWINGRMELAYQQAETDTEGAFRTTGLFAGEYWVYPRRVPGYRIRLGGPSQPGRKVLAPTRGVDVTFARATVRITNEEQLAPDKKGILTIEREDARQFSCDFKGLHGIPAFSATPGERLVVEVRFEGMQSWREPIVMPPQGDELVRVIHLQPAGEPAILELEVKGVESAPVTDVSLRFFTNEEDGERLFDAAAEVVDGVALFESVFPGSYRVVVRADKWFTHYETCYMDVELEIDLAWGQVERRPITLELGGRLAITVRDPLGKQLPAKVELRDANGTKLDVKYVSHTEGGWWHSTWNLTTRGPCETFPNLTPGEYELHLSYAGFERKVLPVQVEAGSSKRVDIVLNLE